MGRVFKHFDYCDGNRRIDRQEFYVGLKELGVDVSKKEAQLLMDFLDKNQDGTIDYEEFLVGIRVCIKRNNAKFKGRLNETRQQVVDLAYKKFDKDNSGALDMADVKMVYNAKMHPKVKEGKMTEEEVFVEFLKNFGDANGDGKITKKEWDDYYSAISAGIDEDVMFVGIMKEVWKLE